MAPLRSLAAAGLAALAVAEEPRQLGFSFGDVQVSGTGSTNPFSATSPQLGQSQPVSQSSSSSSDPFASSFSNTPFGADTSQPSSSSTGLGGPPLTSQTGSSMLQGMIRSFLAGKQLQPGEEQCLEQGCSSVGGQAATVAQNIAMVGQQYEVMKNGGETTSNPSSSSNAEGMMTGLKNMMTGGGGSASPTPAASLALPTPESLAPAAPIPAPAPAANADTVMNMFNWAQGRRLQLDPAAMMGGGVMAANLAEQVHKLGDLGGAVAEKCLQSDGKSTLKQAALNAKNPAFLAKSMSTHGPQAFGNLATAMSDWKKQNASGFGGNIGDALRDILLNNGAVTTLPEGLPDKKTLGNVTGGFLKGFFGPGTTATIKTPEMPNGMTIDLNKCVGNNVNLMQSMGSIMNFYGKQATTSATAAAASAASGASANSQNQATMLAYAAMQMPTALKQCNIGPEQEQALKDAITGMGKGTSVSFSAPPVVGETKTQAVGDLADSVAGYQQLLKDPSTAPAFGNEVGQLFQKAVETTFSQKYFVDEQGRLQHKLLQLSGAGGITGAGSAAVTPVLLVLTVVLLLLALVALKGRRALAGWKEHLCQTQCPSGALLQGVDHDLEEAADDERPMLDNVE